MKLAAAFASALGVAALTMVGARAQGESPPSTEDFIVLDPVSGEYSLDLSVLSPVGEVVTLPPTGWPLTPPDFLHDLQMGDATISPFMMVYNQYVSPQGYYVLVPTLYTAIVMSVTNASPFDVSPSGMVVNGFIGVAGYMGWMESIGYSQEDVLNGDWTEDAEFWTNLFLAINDPENPLHEGTLFLPPAVFIYTCDPTNPADCAETQSPEATPGPPATPPSSGSCPTPTAVQADIRASGRLIAPPYPIVVGQDAARRGADLSWRIEVPPVIYTWYQEVVVGSRTVCAYEPTGTSDGCTGPGAQYDEVVGSAVGWQSFMASGASARYWRASPGEPRIDCVKHVEVFTDRLAWARTSASLADFSREWILNELAARYPGARVYKPDWTWLPPVLGSAASDGTFVWEWTESHIAFRDPGEYQQSASGATTGTPVTAPRSFNLPVESFSVWLHEATLSR